MKRHILSLVCVLTLVGIFSPLFGYRNGITGQTRTGCTCHNATPSQQTSITLQGSQTVDPESVTSFTLRVQNSIGVHGGFNLGVYDGQGNQAGTLIPVSGQGVSLTVGELTHTSRKFMSGTPRAVTWSFQWKAPSTPGRYTFQGAGNAVNGDGQASSSDQWNFLSPVTITVRGMVLSSPTTTASYCGGDTVVLRWTSYSVPLVNIAYTSNGGQTWNLLTSLETTDGTNTYAYVIPGTVTSGSQHRFRIVSAENELLVIETPNLTFNPRTTITTQPQQAWWGCEGSAMTLSIRAAGANLTYQWYRNEEPVPGATGMQLSIPSMQPSQAGTYTCHVTGACGTAISRPANVSVTTKPRLSAQSSDTTLTEGTELVLYIAATGDSLQYQWLKDGTPLDGATAPSYRVSSATLSAAGVYTAQIRNSCQTITSSPIRVQVQSSTSVAQDEIADVQVYPLPAKDRLTVTWQHPITTLALFDSRGQRVIVEQVRVPSSMLSLDFSEHGIVLTPGLYLLQLRSTTKHTTIPLIIE